MRILDYPDRLWRSILGPLMSARGAFPVVGEGKYLGEGAERAGGSGHGRRINHETRARSRGIREIFDHGSRGLGAMRVEEINPSPSVSIRVTCGQKTPAADAENAR